MFKKDEAALALYVARLSARSALSTEERNALTSMPHELSTYRAGHDIVRPEETTDGFHIVVSGFVCGFAQRRDGTRQAVSLYLRGDLADPASVMLPVAVTGLQTFSASSLLHIRRASLQAVVTNFPAVGRALHYESAVRLYMQAKWTEIVGRGSAISRLAHLLCEIATRQTDGEPDDGVNFELPLTQYQMADAIAITPVHLNRTMRALRRQGLMELTNHVVTLPQWRPLCAVAQFNPRYLRHDDDRTSGPG